MRMNAYLWSLYLKSGGQAVVARFASFETGNRRGFSDFILSLVMAYCPDTALAHDFVQDIDNAITILEQPEEAKEDAVEDTAAKSTLKESRTYADDAEEDWQDFRQALPDNLPVSSLERETLHTFCDSLTCFSVVCYADAPSVYIPYFFLRLYNVLTAIATLFEIDLPEVPGPKNYKDRFLFYYALCSTFSNLQKEQGWSSAELCAFLYDFAPKFAGGTSWIWQTLPEPHAAFVIGAPPDTSERWQFAKEKAIFSWQGNPDTQPGDMVLLYQWTPVSAFTSVWQAVAPGFIDPFFWYYRCIYMGNPTKILPLSFKTLKSNPVLSQIPLIKAHMQGMNGTELKPSQYNALVELIHKEGSPVPALPMLTNHFDAEPERLVIRTEHDVELLLLEPLLDRLGWTREQYVRQLPLHMGRGNCVYPDYVILPQLTPHSEKGFCVVEAKKTISSTKQLHIDCRQAASYAYRLDASKLMLVAQEGIWLADRKDDFTQLQSYSWEQLQNNDVFSEINAVIGNHRRKAISTRSHHK